MIDRSRLLSDLQRVLRTLEADLIERSESADVPEVGATLKRDYASAKEAERTAQNWEDWRKDYATQMAAAWVLSCVFARFLEDNGLVDPPRLAGPGERLTRARDEHELYFRRNPTLTDREYLLDVFDGLRQLPGGDGLLGEHNPIRELPNWLSGDAAGELLRFFQKVNPDTGELVHDFADSEWDTRFLGDLYQDLSEEARKKYALLQTPEFVEEFILDRTLDPALDGFGLDAPAVKNAEGDEVAPAGFRMIDPACGSGHFLLGAFRRILDRWQKKEPGTNVRELARRSIESIYGVDLNPYAAAIARFRLLLEAMRACGVTRLAEAPDFRLNIYVGDSLLHGSGEQLSLGWRDYDHAYHGEDAAALRRVLRNGRYHAVVANPPYVTPKDKSLNEAYRDRYTSCHMKYSLAAPFFERILRLAIEAGFTGQITANSFMKREFGRKLVTDVLPSVDVTHVIDTAGAFIPGHATPTVILFSRNRPATASLVRTAMGVRGEPDVPADPARGKVWLEILNQIDLPGSKGEFITVLDRPRSQFHRHPWSIGGGGASELKTRMDESAVKVLRQFTTAIGVFGMTNAEPAMLAPASALRRKRVERTVFRPIITGETVRDWGSLAEECVIFPYVDRDLVDIEAYPGLYAWLWPARTVLGHRATFSKRTYFEEGRPWWGWHQVSLDRLSTRLSITFANIASHNHFALERGDAVFNVTAFIIKCGPKATNDDHLAILGLLNSSAAGFWLKQVAHQKQMMAGDSVRFEAKSKVPYAFSGTQVGALPMPRRFHDEALRSRLVDLSRVADEAARELDSLVAISVVKNGATSEANIGEQWEAALLRRNQLRQRLVWAQEEIDFVVYVMYELSSPELLDNQIEPLQVEPGSRPFEIHSGSSPDGHAVLGDFPPEWPESMRQLWSRRLETIASSPAIGLIEDAHYKRRWIGRQGKFNTSVRSDDLYAACDAYLHDLLESYLDADGRMGDERRADQQFDAGIVSISQLADVAARDPAFHKVGAVLRSDAAFDVHRLVTELVEAESVPHLPVLRYKDSGLRKRAEWERTWDLQRQEDAIDARLQLPPDDPRHLSEADAADLKRREMGDIPVPPKYTSADFLKSDYWRLRGKLDVPKERWVSFPHCEGPDGTLMIAWAGYDHLQLARAISAYYVDVQERLGGRDDPRLVPLLASLIELLPWLKQWHNEPDPAFDGLQMGDYFEGFVHDEARQMGRTLDEIRAWKPPARTGGRGRRRAAT